MHEKILFPVLFSLCRELLFTSRTEEITVLRELSDALVRNLFSKSLWSHEVHRCALNEIVATKGKKALSSLLLKEPEPHRPLCALIYRGKRDLMLPFLLFLHLSSIETGN